MSPRELRLTPAATPLLAPLLLALPLLLQLPPGAGAQAVTTVVGTPGVSGQSNGQGTTGVTLSNPVGIALSAPPPGAAGPATLFVTSDNVLRSVAMSGLQVSQVYLPTFPAFSDAQGAALDPFGNLYVADYSNCVVYAFSTFTLAPSSQAPAPQRTLAGSTAACGTANGVGSNANFLNPINVAADAVGRVFVADYSSCRVRMVVASSSTVTTLAGNNCGGAVNGVGSAAQFSILTGVAVNLASTIVYAADGNNLLRAISIATGAVTAFAGSGSYGSANGVGSNAQFAFAQQMYTLGTGLAVAPNGVLYVADASTSQVRAVQLTGAVTTLAGNNCGSSAGCGYGDGAGTAAKFALPQGLAVDASGSTLYVADSLNSVVRAVALSYPTPPLPPAPLVSAWVGGGAQGAADGTGTSAQFTNPVGAAVYAGTSLYVTSASSIRVVDIATAAVSTVVSNFFSDAQGLAVSATGQIYVADFGLNAVYTFSVTSYSPTLLAGGTYGSADAAGSSAQFANPIDVAVDAVGRVFVADFYNCECGGWG